MTTCNGDGNCLMQCFCDCYNKKIEEYYELCVCGHREHNGYCPSNCCYLIECKNYKNCKMKLPKWVLLCSNDMCINCDIQMGKTTYLNQLEECCVCLENKNMLILKCKHKICNDCWYNISKPVFQSLDKQSRCPLCRNVNDWS